MFVTFDDRVDSASHAIRSAFAGLHGKDALQYLVKAVLLAAFLMLAGTCATSLPWFAFPSDVSYICPGCYYGRSVLRNNQRVHRQDMFSEGGELSRYNRKWLIWFVALFVLSLFSAFLHLGRSSLGWSYLGPDLGGRSSVLSGISHR